MTNRARLWLALIAAFTLGAVAVLPALVFPGVDAATLAAVGAVGGFWALYGIAAWAQR
jgi:hypothetical protein